MSLNLTNQFLIAMPGMHDPNFQQTVTLVCAHNEDGAMGIVINRPMNIELGEVLDQMELKSRTDAINRQPVFEGGPVHRDRGFIIHRADTEFDSTIHVSDQLAVSTSRDILASMSDGQGPDNTLVALGYAGWGAGQLESEMAANAWLSTPAEDGIIFNLPAAQRWQSAASRLGVDLSTISHDVGHA